MKQAIKNIFALLGKPKDIIEIVGIILAVFISFIALIQSHCANQAARQANEIARQANEISLNQPRRDAYSKFISDVHKTYNKACYGSRTEFENALDSLRESYYNFATKIDEPPELQNQFNSFVKFCTNLNGQGERDRCSKATSCFDEYKDQFSRFMR